MPGSNGGKIAPNFLSKQQMKNLVTMYNEQTHLVIKVRVSRVVTIAELKQKVASHFNTTSSNLKLEINRTSETAKSS
jgi:hypothetical protein